MNTTHRTLLRVLEERSYQALKIKRLGKECCLIIEVAGKDHVFVNQFGDATHYRHTWQIRRWLHERFGVSPDTVSVEVYRMPS